ncbi:ArsA family ATPase [Pseudokineococcus lusitanus]|uniref:Anion-transporting ArsA/GET3 family ATPase n=1 Tax=Pseudokineococcus lusitanus TaxID=763993 RepID=A0A3N1HPZ1_9ACTN|nr:ArsA-related P-loop ATPase [Pseudokineococcus lusitanus]ROP44593.1 anion-transporting ArsA/GET3 family ATPase [Pseudokineococcus lusitanus]
MSAPGHLDLDALLDDRATTTVVCCGSGGVGKTTTAAALAVRAAERGRRVVVLTIDPARRLAQSLGLDRLDDTPRPVGGLDTAAGGSLDAMVLDMKRTFDEVVESHATPERARAIFDNPFYEAMSTSFSGTSEYMAMEKLGQLRARSSTPDGDGSRPWDLVVVDTPPSRSALDFLDAPRRLSSFLDGRLVRLLVAPARAGGRAYVKVVSGAVGGVTGALSKVLGTQLLDDLQTFVAALDTVFGGFRERAERTYAMLAGRGTAFLVVAVPEEDALQEATYFVERLRGDGMPLAGLVLNRVQTTALPGLPAARAWDAVVALEGLGDDEDDATAPEVLARGDDALAAGLLRLHAARMQRVEAEQALAAGFAARHPDVPRTQVPARPRDVHAVEDLRAVAEDLCAG